ncbi:MAG: hypothetical protein H8D67_05240 [Deltaproteobacteria bacterium]|nr:hypothetical protein [Deltaproteobacteria bacterium]
MFPSLVSVNYPRLYGVQNHPITLSFVANVGEVTITGESRSGRRRASLTANLPVYSPKKGGRLPPRPAARDGAVYPNADGAHLKDEVSVTGVLDLVSDQKDPMRFDICDFSIWTLGLSESIWYPLEISYQISSC